MFENFRKALLFSLNLGILNEIIRMKNEKSSLREAVFCETGGTADTWEILEA